MLLYINPLTHEGGFLVLKKCLQHTLQAPGVDLK